MLPELPLPKFKRASIGMLLIIMVVGIVLRVSVATESLWLDELHTAWTVLVGDAELSQRAQLGNNSSAYFFCVRIATQIFGVHEWSLRLVSLVAGCLLIPATFFACRFWRCNQNAALCAAAMVAIDRNACFFASEARPYALVQLMGLVHLVLFSRLLSGRRRLWTWVLWILTGIALFQLHCTSALVVAAEVVACAGLAWWRYPIKIQPRYLLIGFGVIAVGMFANWELIHVLAERRDNWSHFVKMTRNPIAVFTIYPAAVYLLAPVIIATIWTLLRSKIGRVGNVAPDEEESVGEQERAHEETYLLAFVVCGCWLFVPLVTAWTLTEFDLARLFFRRYLIASSVTLAPLSALLISSFSRRPKEAGWYAIIVFAIAAVLIRPTSLTRVREDWRMAVDAIEQSSIGRPVLLYSGLIESDAWWNTDDATRRQYCEFPVRGIYSVADERQVVALPRSFNQADLALPSFVSQDVWLLVRSKSPSNVEKAVVNSLGEQWRVVDRKKCGRLELMSLQNKPRP